MSQTERKTARLGGVAGFSIHAVQAAINGSPVYRRNFGEAGTSAVYTRVELWRDVDNEADILCSVALTYSAKRKDVLDQIRGCLPANLPSDDAAFLTGLVIQAYLHRAI
jgi:hypothetical protein